MKSVSFIISALFTRISNPPSVFTAFLNVSINKKLKKLIFFSNVYTCNINCTVQYLYYVHRYNIIILYYKHQSCFIYYP